MESQAKGLLHIAAGPQPGDKVARQTTNDDGLPHGRADLSVQLFRGHYTSRLGIKGTLAAV